MNREEFLNKLAEALKGQMNPSDIQSQIEYYDGYIKTEASNGRHEYDVVAELGDPWALAHNLVEQEEISEGNTYSETTYGGYNYYQKKDVQQDEETGHRSSKWNTIKWIIMIVAIVVMIIFVVGGIFAAVMPILIPVLLVWVVVRMFAGSGR
ncbi:MAG: DUF1700 domain-containing protein [Lachnospiraceae bacterium]|jgi:uncharacterized membrane protein|nr:DUF1700 domain-containing protein [Lachnospiraceae bacterium]